jgi:hypothetical protein
LTRTTILRTADRSTYPTPCGLRRKAGSSSSRTWRLGYMATAMKTRSLRLLLPAAIGMPPRSGFEGSSSVLSHEDLDTYGTLQLSYEAEVEHTGQRRKLEQPAPGRMLQSMSAPAAGAAKNRVARVASNEQCKAVHPAPPSSKMQVRPKAGHQFFEEFDKSGTNQLQRYRGCSRYRTG